MLFYLSNLDHTAFLAAQIKNGAVVVSYDKRKGSVKEVTVKSKTNLTDGNWHTVLVKKHLQRITVTVDQKYERRGKISKAMKVDVPLFVGGVPKSFLPLLNKKVVRVFFTQIFVKLIGVL